MIWNNWLGRQKQVRRLDDPAINRRQSDLAKQYRADGQNARTVAEETTDEFRQVFMQLADEYERMAREIEAE
jgi:hypothetical protein